MATRGTIIVLLLSATLALAPAATATASVDADTNDGEIDVTVDPEEEEKDPCRPHCLPLSSSGPLDALPGDPEEEEEDPCDPHCIPTSEDGYTVTVETPAGEAEVVVHAVQLDGDALIDMLPGDPEEEEEESPCRPHCLPLSFEDGEAHVDGSAAEATIVVEPVALSGDPLLDLLPSDDPEEEEENGPCDPHC